MPSRENIEIQILEKLIEPSYPKFLTQLILVSSQRIAELTSRSVPDIEHMRIESVKDNACIRLNLRLPLSLFSPQSFNLLSRKIHYFDTRAPAAFLATYVQDLNHFTLMHLHGTKRIHEYFPNSAQRVLVSDVYERFKFERNIPPQFSSLNFLLRNWATNIERPNITHSKIVDQCFTYSYWRLPAADINNDYDSFHNFIYHGYTELLETCDVFKTLVKIVKIDSSVHQFDFLQDRFQYRAIQGKILSKPPKFTSLNTRLFVVEPLASELEPGDIVNCIIIRRHAFKNKNSLLVIAGKLGSIMRTPSLSDLKVLTSIAVHTHLNNLNAFKFIESITLTDLQQQLFTILSSNKEFFDESWSKLFDQDGLDVSITGLNPLLHKHDDFVYIIPPALLSYMSLHNLRFDLFSDLVKLINLVKINDLRSTHSLDPATKGILRRSDHFNNLQKADPSNPLWKNLFDDLPHLLNYISYSRILARSFTITE